MTFLNYLFTPRLFCEYGHDKKIYEPGCLEKWGDRVISTLNTMFNVSMYASPLLLIFLYRCGYFVTESMWSFAKWSSGLGVLFVVSVALRGIGRSQTDAYIRFARTYEMVKLDGNNTEAKKQLRHFDYTFNDWPVDFHSRRSGKRSSTGGASNRSRSILAASLPCDMIAYGAIHTIGLRMIYPGSMRIIRKFLNPMLIQGRAKLIEDYNSSRYKVQTEDDNFIDTLFVDNREKNANGKTLVICSEGNVGFYEIGIMQTPIDLQYSVLGWNHPGFGESTGSPYPKQDQNAIDAVMQMAIEKLGFLPENIVLFGWSIGGYSSIWVASQYPGVKGVILDATFDDILYLAIPRMPAFLSGIVHIAIRDYVNLNNGEEITKFDGPVLLIRRTEDEIICIEENNMSTNRGNFLLMQMLKHRFPVIFDVQQLQIVEKMLSKPLENSIDLTPADENLCVSLLISYISQHGVEYPVKIGAAFTRDEKSQMASFLVRKHMADFKSTHCTPLPTGLFHLPWDIPNDTDFVFT